jgi:2-polyprenyl-3-methyl-5-hydroxy-6-metoxy-1,4-benzoquinol methylase
MRRLAGWLANSPWLRRGRRLYEANEKDYFLPLSKADKVLTGGYLILRDYAAGRFPPTFEDQARAYQAEKDYRTSLRGKEVTQIREGELRKPFWDARATGRYLRAYVKLLCCLEALDLRPPARLLELGCGTGWLAEFLALNGYDVLGTSLADWEIADAGRRLLSLEAKQLEVRLNFQVAPMETVHEHLAADRKFQAVYVFEALHHAFSWEQTLAAAYQVLEPGGWLVIANEPNRAHTFVSYRVGQLSNTHEIGMCRRRLLRRLRQVGFRETRVFGNRLHGWVLTHWLASRK